MKLLSLLLVTLSACGSIIGDNATFDVTVHDASNHGIADAIVTLHMASDTSDHVCGKTDTNGRATITWNACQFTELRCERNPYSVSAEASGYVAGTTTIGFSQEGGASVKLDACADGASCPEPTPCKD